ncbi:MAG: M10 family metallopeptidase [Cyanobacteria bacterium P01_F01_bin.150]
MSISFVTGTPTIPFNTIGSFAEQNKTVGLDRSGLAPEADFYIFSLSEAQAFTVNISDISANGDVDLQLFTYTDVDGDGPYNSLNPALFDPDDLLEVIATSLTLGSVDETISINLAPGSYAVQVSRANASPQPRFSYDISMTAESLDILPPPPVDFSYIDALLWGGNKWGSNIADNPVNQPGNEPNEPTIITYSFWNDASLDDDFYAYDTLDTPWFDYEMAAVETGLEFWANVANIEFVPLNDNSPSADLKFTLVNDSEIGFGILGQSSPPQTFAEGMTYFNWQGLGWDSAGLQPGGYGFVTVLHELGHGLGLAHPHDDSSGSATFPGVEGIDADADGFIDSYTTGLFGLNQGVWTTMSYNDGLDADSDGREEDGRLRLSNYGYQASPMTLDIGAIQALYGINPNHNNGDDIYELPSQNGPGTAYTAIWDTGGNDTISAIASLTPVTIDLNDAPLTGPNAGGYISSADGVYGGLTIANGVVIENAVGGSSDDTLFGNEFDNLLQGIGGDDILFGENGDDMLDGGDGDDIIDGGDGADVIWGSEGDDFLDGWTGNDTLIGNEGDDTLLGFTGNDILYGGQGSDQLLGEADSDTLIGYNGGIQEYDVLTGDLSSSVPNQIDILDGADRFVLGDSIIGAYYIGFGYATITDFYWLEGDRIQLYGSIADYTIGFESWSGSSALDSVIRYRNDIIGIVEDTTDVVLTQDFDFVV